MQASPENNIRHAQTRTTMCLGESLARLFGDALGAETHVANLATATVWAVGGRSDTAVALVAEEDVRGVEGEGGRAARTAGQVAAVTTLDGAGGAPAV